MKAQRANKRRVGKILRRKELQAKNCTKKRVWMPYSLNIKLTNDYSYTPRANKGLSINQAIIGKKCKGIASSGKNSGI